MVYDKFQVSLFEKGSSLPKMLVCIDKRSSELFLVCKQQKEEEGLLFVFYQSSYFVMEVRSAFCEFKLPKKEFVKTMTAAFYGNNTLYVGGFLSVDEQALKKFEEKRAEILARRVEQQTQGCDPNFVSDSIMQKMFGSVSPRFFDHTKAQLVSLFSCSARADALEKLIPSSKFVETYSEGAKAYAGIVYKSGVPFAIGIGFDFDGSEMIKNQSSFQYFYGSDRSKSGAGYFLSFRRATDGDKIEIK